MSWGPFSQPSTLLFCASTLKTKSGQSLQMLGHTKAGPLVPSEDRRQRGQARFQWGSQAFGLPTEWPCQEVALRQKPSPHAGCLLRTVPSYRDTGLRTRDPGKRARNPEVFGGTDKQNGLMAGNTAACRVLMWRPHCLRCLSGNDLVVSREDSWTLTLCPVGKPDVLRWGACEHRGQGTQAHSPWGTWQLGFHLLHYLLTSPLCLLHSQHSEGDEWRK